MLEARMQQVQWSDSIRSARDAVYRLCAGGLIAGIAAAAALPPVRARLAPR